jgi:hypothetical protein
MKDILSIIIKIIGEGDFSPVHRGVYRSRIFSETTVCPVSFSFPVFDGDLPVHSGLPAKV